MVLIEVAYDAAAGTLGLSDPSQQEVSLAPEEGVVWQFVGLPNDWIPSVHFLAPEDGDSILGPFANLRQTQSQVIACGRRQTGQERYVVTAHAAGSSPQSDDPSFEARLMVDPGDADSTAPKIFVRPGEEPGELTVSPEYFTIVAGDTAEWIFEGFAEPSWYPVVSFDGGPEGSAAWPYGPFTSLCTADKTVIGAGNSGVVGDYTYSVATQDTRTGEVLRRWDGDPGMGNNGDPPGGGGG